MQFAAARLLVPRLQQVEGASYTFVTGGAGESARSAMGQINAQAVWGLAAAMRSEAPTLKVAEVRVGLKFNRSVEERREEPRDTPLSHDIGTICAGLAAAPMDENWKNALHNLDSNAEQVQDLRSLGKLAQLRAIECKLAHASDVPDFGPVFGVMHDKEGDVLTYESRGDINPDEIRLDVQSSCQDWERCQRVESKFRDLWNGSKSEVSTTDISQKFNATVQVLTGRESSLYESEDDQKFDRSKLWPHQQVAFDRFLESKRGVLEMATGTGKTRTALAIGKSLAENQKIDQIIISTGGTIKR